MFVTLYGIVFYDIVLQMKVMVKHPTLKYLSF